MRTLWRWVVLVLVTSLTSAPSAQPAPTCSGPTIALPQVCGANLAAPTISCAVPADVQGGLRQENFNVVQRASDLFSWQNLIALHWPALPGQRGVPDPNRPLGSLGATVWETWKETSEVFREVGGRPVAPASWDTPQPLPAACGTATKLLFRDEKVNDALDAVVQPTYADGTLPGTLTDQKRRRVRYEIRMNRTAFDYVVAHDLWNGDVQIATSQVSFPPGAQIAKAAWRELDPGTNSRYQWMEACLCESGPNGPQDCRVRTVGLVGFHLMTKTPSAPQWIWSTFEQADNVSGLSPSFHDNSCPPSVCPPNRQRAAGLPNQITRVIPIPATEPNCAAESAAVDNLVRLNADMKRGLPVGTPLQNYELVSTQWPVPPAAGVAPQPSTVFSVRPALLGNTTLETYIQDTSSCMGCHAVAGLDRRSKWVSADFTFTLNDAYPNPNITPTNPLPNEAPAYDQPLPAPAQAVTPWDQAHWADIERGYRIATQTYETLPKNVGSKLHCASCHLGGGRDPRSSWWVGMHEAYPTPEKLYNRINQCFERSENGTAICSLTNAPPGETCATNVAMQSVVTYMDWLDEQWRARGDKAPPARGFPCLSSVGVTASAPRGASVYLQKCAFCHGAAGEGRYESDTYYRPALWGDLSFNGAAGMAVNLEDLAAFIHANMPYGNAGALTPQEAWDVAFFIGQQPRPGKTGNTPMPSPPVVCP